MELILPFKLSMHISAAQHDGDCPQPFDPNADKTSPRVYSTDLTFLCDESCLHLAGVSHTFVAILGFNLVFHGTPFGILIGVFNYYRHASFTIPTFRGSLRTHTLAASASASCESTL